VPDSPCISHPHRVFAAPIALAGAALLLFAISLAARAQDNALVVSITSGLVRGVARTDGGAQFLGIPYARPPVGKLRWGAPMPAKHWSGIRNANAPGASCIQPLLVGNWNRYDVEHSREDCLYLNVITPTWPSAKPLPVFFWIHGGANLGGSGSGDLYNSGTLLNHGVLIVTFNYRLGVFGFFAHPELTRESKHHASGNYGLMDQILALQWVRDNVARFGGDPNNITVAGQSAGSMDTGMLMTSPLAVGLFQKAIGESGAAFSPPVISLADAERFGEETTAALNAPAASHAISFLRNIPAADLLSKLGSRATQWPNGFTPDVDGWVLPTSPRQIFESSQEAAIPLLLGVTSREFGSGPPLDELRNTIQKQTGDLAPQALALYDLSGNQPPDPDPLYGSASVQWGADDLFHCPITTEALWHAATHNPTFEYEFDRPIPGQEAQGALHSAELPYVFGFFPKSGNIGGTFSAVDMRLADLIQTYWTNFAKTGDPNSPASSDLPNWPALDQSQTYLLFTVAGNVVVSTSPLRGPQCNLYRKVLAAKMKHDQ